MALDSAFGIDPHFSLRSSEVQQLRKGIPNGADVSLEVVVYIQHHAEATGSPCGRGSATGLPQHPDEHRPECRVPLGDSRAPLGEARSVFDSVGSPDRRIVLYPGAAHGTTLVEVPPYGATTWALLLEWIESHIAGG